MNKQQLASKIWESANRMRSKIEANEYKDYILGFIFYKFLSDREVKYLKENDWTDEYPNHALKLSVHSSDLPRTKYDIRHKTASFMRTLQRCPDKVFTSFHHNQISYILIRE